MSKSSRLSLWVVRRFHFPPFSLHSLCFNLCGSISWLPCWWKTETVSCDVFCGQEWRACAASRTSVHQASLYLPLLLVSRTEKGQHLVNRWACSSVMKLGHWKHTTATSHFAALTLTKMVFQTALGGSQMNCELKKFKRYWRKSSCSFFRFIDKTSSVREVPAMGSLGALKRQRAPVGRSQESDIIKGSLVHKLPSCGRMSMASLVITSTTTVAVCRWERLSTATVQECFHGCGPRSGKAVDKKWTRL